MNSVKWLGVLISVMFLNACATDTGPKAYDWAKAVQTENSRDAHLRLAEHYEQIAKTLAADVQEEQAILNEYKARPWKYGKRIQDLKSQANAMVQDLQKAVEDSEKMANYHRQMAAE